MELPTPLTNMLKKLPQRSDPVRDWLTLLTVAAVLLGVIIVGNIRLFDTIANGGSIAPPMASSTPTIDDTLLQNVETLFAARAAQEEKYASTTDLFADPSQ